MSSSSTPESTRASLSEGRDRQRGYSVNTKLVVLAYGTEAVIATASLIGAAIFARQYGDGDWWLMAMMMLAPIGYAAVEISRVPLALAVRTQPSFLFRIVAIIGVLCAAGVTVKSMSQLGEIMFRPRLVNVMHARQRLDDATKVAANLELKITEADRLIAQRSGELQSAERQLALATDKLGGLPEQKCLPTSGMTLAAAQIIRQSKETPGLGHTILMGGGSLAAPDFIEATGPSIVGFRIGYPDVSSDSMGQGYPKFVTEYKEMFGEAPTSGFHANAYDAAMMALKAIETVAKADKDGNLFIGKKALRDAVYATKFDGLSGPIACDAYGQCASFKPAVLEFTSADPKTYAIGTNPKKIWP